MARRLYWDACVFIDYLAKTPGRYEQIAAIMDKAADEGLFEIYTSRLTVVEVVYIGEDLDQDLREIGLLWEPSSPITMVEVHSGVTEDAVALIRQARSRQPKVKLKTADAVHLATARRMNVHEVQTYDDDLIRLSEMLGTAIREPTSDFLF